MSKGRVLVVDDDKALAKAVGAVLEAEGYSVLAAHSAFQAEGAAARFEPELVVLDRKLPDGDGLEICRRLRGDPRRSRLPVLFLSDKGSVADKVSGFAVGGDDYLPKPFSMEELVVRVSALLRRARPLEPEERVLRSGHVSLDLATGKASVRGKAMDLPPKELGLLQALLESGGRILSRRHLLERVWGYDPSVEVSTRAVDAAACSLRAKLGRDGKRLVAVTGQGYRFDPAG